MATKKSRLELALTGELLKKEQEASPLSKALKGEYVPISSQEEREEKAEVKFDPVKQSEGIETRLEGAGLDPEKEIDTRNWFEKVTNLPEGQNVLFDVFELLNRPQTAIFSGIKSAIEGEDFGEGLVKGFTGEERVSGSDVVTAMTGEDNFLTKTLGFAADIFLDPLDLAVWGVALATAVPTGGASVAGAVAITAANALDTAGDVAKGIKALDAAVDTAQIASKLDDVKDITKVLHDTIDTMEDVGDPLTKIKGDVLKEASELGIDAGKEALDNPQGAFGFSDWWSKYKTAKKEGRIIDTRQLLFRNTKDLTKYVFKKGDQFTRWALKRADDLKSAGLSGEALEQFVGMADKYDGAVTSIKKLWGSMTNVVKELGEKATKATIGRIRKASENLEIVRKMGLDMTDELQKSIVAFAEKNGMTPEETDKMVQAVFEASFYKPTSRISEFITPQGVANEIIDAQDYNRFYNYFAKNFGGVLKQDEVANLFVKMKDGSYRIQRDALMTTLDKLEGNVKYHKFYYETLNDLGVGKRNSFTQKEAELFSNKMRERFKDVLDDDTIDAFFTKKVYKTNPDNPRFILNRQKLEDELNRLEELEGGIAVPPDIARIEDPKLRMKEMREYRRNYNNAVRRLVRRDDRMGIVDRVFRERGKFDVQTRVDIPTKNKIIQFFNENMINPKTGKPMFELEQLEQLFDKKILEGGAPIYFLNNEQKEALWKEIDKFRKGLSAQAKIKFDDALEMAVEAPRFISDDTKAFIEMATENGWLLEDGEFYHLIKQYDEYKNRTMELVDAEFKTNFSELDGEGYVRHKVMDDVDLKKFSSNKNVFSGRMLDFSDRKYRMSAKEANEVVRAELAYYAERNKGVLLSQMEAIEKKAKKLGTDVRDTLAKKQAAIENIDDVLEEYQDFQLFEEELTKSFSDFVVDASDRGVKARKFDTIINSNILDDQDMFKTALKDGNSIDEGTKMRGYENVKKEELIKKAKFFYENMAGGEELFAKLSKKLGALPDNILVNNAIWSIIGRDIKQEANVFVKALDVMNDTFKQNKLFSIGFHTRNIFGNMMNLFLSGADVTDFSKGIPDAVDVLKNGEELLSKVARFGEKSLTADEVAKYALYKRFRQAGFGHMGAGLVDQSGELDKVLKRFQLSGKIDTKKAKAFDLMKKSRDLNETVDNTYRMAALMYVEKHPELLERLNLKDAEEFVRYAFFDPRDLTGFEKTVMKRLVPFYTFTKKNLAYHMSNVALNPGKYDDMLKSLQYTYDLADLSDDDVEQYKKENMWIPIAKKETGEYMMLKLNLPQSDLGEWLSQPLRRGLSSLAPSIRAPFEIAANKQVFNEMEIERFKGEKGYALPWMSKKAEYAASQVGVDVPLKLATATVTNLVDLVKGNSLTPADFLSSVVSESSVDKSRTTAAYQKLNKLQERLKYYKQQGVDLPTIQDIENVQKTRQKDAWLARLKSIYQR